MLVCNLHVIGEVLASTSETHKNNLCAKCIHVISLNNLGYQSGYIRDLLERGICMICTFVICIEQVQYLFVCLTHPTAGYIQYELIPAEEIKLAIQIGILVTHHSEVYVW